MVDKPRTTRYLTMRRFGHWGRAGNQFFQYAFLTSYALRHGLELQLPPWIGNELFDTYDLPVSVQLPTYTEPTGPRWQGIPPIGDEITDHDFEGYAQYHTSCIASDRERITRIFQPTAAVRDRLSPIVDKLRGHTVLGVHLRRGDYGRRIFPIIPTSWYLKWLDEHWQRFDDPVLFVATEDAGLVADFAKYDPQTTSTLGLNLSSQPLVGYHYLSRELQERDPRAMDFYPDFYLLSQCDVVLGPSSTFSFFAAMLGLNLREFWRASLSSARFDRVDPWDAYPLLRECVRDFPHLPGISVASNPYW